MLHMMMEDSMTDPEFDMCYADVPYPSTQTFVEATAVERTAPHFAAETSAQRSDTAQCQQISASIYHIDKNTFCSRADEYSPPNMRYRPYQIQRPPIYTSASQNDFTNNRERQHFEVNSTWHHRDAQGVVSSISPTCRSTLYLDEQAGNALSDRNCNNSNNNSQRLNQVFQNDRIKVSSSHPHLYGSSIDRNHHFETPVYSTSTVVPNFSFTKTDHLTADEMRHSRLQNIAMPCSPDAYGKESKESKKRGAKKRKKKGTTEPQRPVSAYALFFRHTQAAIKAENTSATFGEISKIVASMWDNLTEEDKQVYKQKTENAKRDYLKHLAAYRANMISNGNSLDEEEVPPPMSYAEKRVATTSSLSLQERQTNSLIIDLTASNLPLPQKTSLAPRFQILDEQQATLQSTLAMSVPAPALQQSSSPISTGTSSIKTALSGQIGFQCSSTAITAVPSDDTAVSVLPTSPISNHMILRADEVARPATRVTSSTISLPIRNIAAQLTRSEMSVFPRNPEQVVTLLSSESGGVTFFGADTGTMTSGTLHPSQTTSSCPTKTHTSTESSKRNEQAPIRQFQTPNISQHNHEINLAAAKSTQDEANNLDVNSLMQIPQQNLLPSGDLRNVEDLISRPSENAANKDSRLCLRDGCRNLAVSCPFWDNEYCSNECIYSHCRDVFDAWMSGKQVTSSSV